MTAIMRARRDSMQCLHMFGSWLLWQPPTWIPHRLGATLSQSCASCADKSLSADIWHVINLGASSVPDSHMLALVTTARFAAAACFVFSRLRVLHFEADRVQGARRDDGVWRLFDELPQCIRMFGHVLSHPQGGGCTP